MPIFTRLLFACMLLLPSLCGAQELTPWSGAAPPLALASLDGGLQRLSDYRGRVVLVNFWASWCGPCRAEMPSIEQLRRSLEREPFAVLAVNVGEDAATVRSFAGRVAMGFALLLDPESRVTRAWGARALPTSFVIGPDGHIRYRAIGERDWSDPQIRAALRALMPGAQLPQTARADG
jgi:thiol-disulfide isomerase/thioredoxin